MRGDSNYFYPGDWKNIKRTWNGEKCRFCKSCVDILKDQLGPAGATCGPIPMKLCGRCGAYQSEHYFLTGDWVHRKRRSDDGDKCRFCRECVETLWEAKIGPPVEKSCGKCGKRGRCNDFHPGDWRNRKRYYEGTSTRFCKTCADAWLFQNAEGGS